MSDEKSKLDGQDAFNVEREKELTDKASSQGLTPLEQSELIRRQQYSRWRGIEPAR